MNETMLAFFGISAGIVNVIALVPYLRDIVRKRTKPERATWWVWLALGLVALGAQFAAGARWSLSLTFTSVICMAAIALLSIPYGYGTFHRRDAISLAFAGLGIMASFFMRDPVIAIVVVIAVDLSGMWLTVYKTWAAPRSETLSAWVLATVAAVLAVFAVGEYTVARVAYPIYAVVVQAALIMIIIYRRRRVAT